MYSSIWIKPGQPGFISPGTKEHSAVVSPSKVAAILGISRFQSQYSCWMSMAGRLPAGQAGDIPEIFKVGHAFEQALACLWKEDNPGWRLSGQGVQLFTEEFGFPAVCTLDRLASRGRGRRVVEFKTARDLSEWGDEGGDEAPADYLAQVQAQMMLTGITKNAGHLMVMGPFFKRFNYVIEYDEAIATWMKQKCQEFYATVVSGQQPPLDESVSTYNTVRAMHPEINEGVVSEIDEALWLDLSAANGGHKESERTLRGLKSRLLEAMGNAQTAVVNSEVVATRRQGARGSVALVLK